MNIGKTISLIDETMKDVEKTMDERDYDKACCDLTDLVWTIRKRLVRKQIQKKQIRGLVFAIDRDEEKHEGSLVLYLTPEKEGMSGHLASSFSKKEYKIIDRIEKDTGVYSIMESVYLFDKTPEINTRKQLKKYLKKYGLIYCKNLQEGIYD
jgi:hypothetical protein